MDQYDEMPQGVGQKFVRTSLLPRYPQVHAIYLSGSQLYAAPDSPPDPVGAVPTPKASCLRDWDGALVVGTKRDIFTLVNDQRAALMAMLDMEREECPEHSFRVPAPSSPYWVDFDAVRFAGYDKCGAKRSVKILSLEYFSQSKTTLDILSAKDRRVYETVRPGWAPIRIQQATAITSKLFVLHDEWVFAEQGYSGNAPGVAFGVTADLIVSGACVLGWLPHGKEIKQRILQHYSAVALKHPTVWDFAKSASFSRPYIDWLQCQLSSLLSCTHGAAPGVVEDSPAESKSQLFLFGRTATIRSGTCSDTLAPASELSPEACYAFDAGVATPANRHAHQEKSPFTSNSSTASVVIKNIPGLASTKIFCKKSHYAEDEMQGARFASIYYPRIMIPRLSASGMLIFPFVSGTTESDLRLSYVCGGRKDQAAGETLLHVELVKAEDMLRAYRSSMRWDTADKQTVASARIQRFFYARLDGDKRLQELYGSGIHLGGRSIPLNDFLSMTWTINGTQYPSLRTLFDTALQTLSPESLEQSSCPAAFGLGDAHGGNVMVVHPGARHRGGPTPIYVDYEVAGLHPIALDLAKPFYNDVFFQTFYLDVFTGAGAGACRGPMSYQCAGRTLVVDFAARPDAMSQAILDIKLRYLIRPLCDSIRRANSSPESLVPVLANALLLCATLTRNFATDEVALLHNFATGIVLSTCRNWDQFATSLKKLGFTI